nr:hypothetical protein [Tanacetum cinerariifolium]
SKDETSDILKKFITEIENLKDYKVKIIRCDNGGEFRNKEMNDFCSQKGIKREFSNARTPYNGVAERRNRTLIEAARTMLADAKFPVTFWAEAVNAACYVQNRVLVNKSQNKTPYKLLNGKFEAKGDEGYFIGYSMSSKAFRVFNKRTRRVEENLHVEFLENKAIEQGAGPNWLFDIDSLTKSMNYVPVDAGTNSTNLLGIKDAANQEVKKDESSLRNIVLPNWAHDALLKFTSSKPYEESSTQVPEGSGNPNHTASSSNSTTDQMETLTVESLIPTVSSPVLTACLNDSSEPSSEARLVLKRVANQEETPSLDNILSLTNRLFLAYASFMGFTVYQMDVKSAFLYGTKDEEVYVMQPPGFQDPVPDIMFAVCACARHQVTPKESSPFDLVAYSDSDYGGASQDRKSTTGGKYIAAASCCGQVLWIQNQLLDYGDNQIEDTPHTRTKHRPRCFEGSHVNLRPFIRKEMPLPEVFTAIEEKKKKLPVKDRWQLH